MKLGIITCHDVYNFGATLQAYGLSSFLKKNHIDNEIIDYKPAYLYRLINLKEVDAPKWNRTFWRRWIYRIYMLPTKLSLVPKAVRFKMFNHKFLPLSNQRYHHWEELKQITDYNMYICGSDQIWNSVQYQCGEDPAFYLAFAQNQPKVAYAASFGCSEVSDTGAHNIKKYLPEFDFISVREASGVELLRKYGIRAECVLDPVFLIDRESWRKLRKNPVRLPKKYILLYGYDNRDDIWNVAEEYAQLKQCNIISARHTGFLNQAGPREFLALMDNAEMIVTSSFHAVAFSIILHKQFIAVPTGNADLFERIINLLKICRLEERIWDNLKENEQWKESTINFEAADALLDVELERAKSLLLTAVQGERTDGD